MGFIPLSIAEYDLDMGEAVTEIAVALPEIDEKEKIETLKELVSSSFPGLVVLDWKELAKGFVALAEMKTKNSRILIFLIFIIAAVGISNTMLIAVYERVREIGMMRALGMNNSAIRTTFLLEAGGIGLIGSFIGLLIGALATYHIVNWGIDYTSLIGRMDVGYRVTGIYRGAWHPQAMVTAFILGILMSMGIALIPASRALKMKITDCLRYE
jgi:ABC-type lipoprotein release transport system permease subunit